MQSALKGGGEIAELSIEKPWKAAMKREAAMKRGTDKASRADEGRAADQGGAADEGARRMKVGRG